MWEQQGGAPAGWPLWDSPNPLLTTCLKPPAPADHVPVRALALCTGNGSQGPASQALPLTGMCGQSAGLGSWPWGTEELRGSGVQGPESMGWGRGGHPRQGSSVIQRPASRGARSLVPVSVEPRPQAGAGSGRLSGLPPHLAHLPHSSLLAVYNCLRGLA